jgi:nucleoside-diphosphate-sugar epimerase
MKIVVTGAAGFVGSHLCERLVADGHLVVGIDGMIADSYASADKEQNLAALADCSTFRLFRLDLRRDDLEEAFDGAEVVVHLAAMPGLPVSWKRLDLYAGCNILATGRVIEATTIAGADRFVQVSTSSVYGRFAVGDETQPQVPNSPYGLTKLAAEHLVLAHHRNFGFPALILRYFSIYGPRQRPDMAYHLFIESILDGQPITMFGDGQQARSNTYVDDCVDATVRAVHDGRIGEAYNVGGGELLELRHAITLIGELAGRAPEIIRRPAIPGDQRITQADTTKAREHFGYEPRIGPRVGLQRQLEWHLDRRSRGDRSTLLKEIA